MPSETTQRIPDRTQIHVREQDDICYWMHRFQVTEEELRLAVAAAGDAVTDVKDYLGAV